MDKPHVALVTGARRGIGRSIARSLAASGYDVLMASVHARGGRKPDTVEAEIEALGRRAWVVPADISRKEDRRSLLAFAARRCGVVHLLVNNAGVAPRERADILLVTEKSFDRVLAVNLRGTFFLTQMIARKMVEAIGRGDPGPFRIVNISSISAIASSPSRAEYCISKAGVSMLTKLFADRLAGKGIQVFEIRPGIIATDMTAPVKATYDRLISAGIAPIRRWGTPEDVGKAVAAVASGAFPYSTGEIINVDGGLHLRRL
jgi:3-oxoacyl-[acyl-carrier protein] reductase